MFKCGKVIFTKNKFFEISLKLCEDYKHFFTFDLNLSFKTDHAGIEFIFKLFKFYAEVCFYDTRHWCNQCNKYRENSCYKEGHDGMDLKMYEEYL